MKKDDILKTEAGREMDALVAEKVMGWVVKNNPDVDYWCFKKQNEFFGYGWDWKPSTDISAAWDIVKKLTESPVSVISVNVQKESRSNGDYAMCFIHKFLRDETIVVCEGAETAPLAICRAALVTMMELA